MNLVSINEGSSYFICQDPEVQAWIERTLGVAFVGDVAKAGRMWLRKEIINQDLQQS